VLHFADARRAFRGFADAARGAAFEVGWPPGALMTSRLADGLRPEVSNVDGLQLGGSAVLLLIATWNCTGTLQ